MEQAIERRYEKNYTDTPQFLRVARALAKFKQPYRAADALLSMAGPMLEQEKETCP